MDSRIDVTVAAVIEQNQRFLLVEEQVGGQFVFNQPAGHLEPGESLIDAAIREVSEETGYSFAPDYLVGIYLWQAESGERSYLRVCFTGAGVPPPGTPSLDAGIVATHWLTREQLLSRQRDLRSPLVLRCIDDFHRGIRYPLNCLQHLAAAPVVTIRSA
jgi:8-oxo-dGTP pyrophosphatase MutT (NUDIX family)